MVYLSDTDAWERFEEHWAAHLAEFEVPYLHMKEFSNPDPTAKPYGHLKADKEKEIAFMSGVVRIINENTLVWPACNVRLDDLERFNKKHRLNLDPYSLAIYGCLILMRRVFHNDSIEFVVDRFDKPTKRVELALEYAASDCGEFLKADYFTRIPLPPCTGANDISPLQAADFGAVEPRKYRADRQELRLSSETRDDPEMMLLAIRQWEKHNDPRDRKSFREARKTAPMRPRHFTWEMHDLELLRQRHPNGWGE